VGAAGGRNRRGAARGAAGLAAVVVDGNFAAAVVRRIMLWSFKVMGRV
jgi:hypothetical protein